MEKYSSRDGKTAANCVPGSSGGDHSSGEVSALQAFIQEL